MGTIKLDKDEMLKIAYELSALKEEINYILNKTQETENVLRREKSVSTYSQERKLSDLQHLAYNLVREFDKISDNFYQAAKAYESTEDKLNDLVNINKDNNIRNIIAVNSINNTYFNSDNTKSEEKEETTFDKLKELTQQGWKLFKDYCGLYISAIDFMKDVCDNINTCIDGYLEYNKEFFDKYNEEHPDESAMYQSSQMKVALTDSIIKFLKDMTVGLGSDVLGMLSNEYKGLLEDPLETLSENVESLLMFKAILFPASKEEFEIQDRVLSGIWENIKADFNSEFTNGNTYTKSRYVYNLVIEIGSLFFGAGELKAASGVKKTDNVVDGLRAIDKVSDAKKLSNGELWFNYFNKTYGVENVEWTSKILEGKATLRERVFANIEMSRLVRESSNYRFRFKDGFYFEHMTGPVEKFTQKGGVSGGHNYDEFVKFFQSSNKYEIQEVARRNSSINGIFEIEYKVKVEKKDYAGRLTGEYKEIPSGDFSFYKTVYDSSKISDNEMVRLSKEAMRNGIKNKNIEQLKFQPNKVKVQGETIFNGQIIKFEGYRNLVTNEIENAYPVLP